MINLILDMDGVLLDCRSSWLELHKQFKVDNKENFNKYIDRKITYTEFIRLDLMLWFDKYGQIKKRNVEKASCTIPYMHGIDFLSKWIDDHRNVVKASIITGSIDAVSDRFKRLLKIETLSNILCTDRDDNLTGEAILIVNPDDKGEALKRYMHNKTDKEIIVVGDGEVDIPMFRLATLSIAFNPLNEVVGKNADVVIKEKNLGILVNYLDDYVHKLNKPS